MYKYSFGGFAASLSRGMENVLLERSSNGAPDLCRQGGPAQCPRNKVRAKASKKTQNSISKKEMVLILQHMRNCILNILINQCAYKTKECLSQCAILFRKLDHLRPHS